MARAPASGGHVAGGQHRRRSARPARPREETAAAAPAAAPRRRAPGHDARPTTSGPRISKASSGRGIGIYCYPLTVADQHTRYLLACHGLLSTKGTGVRPVFDRLFREYGLPRAMRTDNGVPFASTALHGLTPLNVWWLRLGIQHQRILPGPPAAERRPRAHAQDAEARGDSTAARDPARPSSVPSTGSASEYNHERPHQCSMGGRPPGALSALARAYTGVLPPSSIPATSS